MALIRSLGKLAETSEASNEGGGGGNRRQSTSSINDQYGAGPSAAAQEALRVTPVRMTRPPGYGKRLRQFGGVRRVSGTAIPGSGGVSRLGGPPKPLLPPLLPQDSQKKTLVLDLDETLVHSSFQRPAVPFDFAIQIQLPPQTTPGGGNSGNGRHTVYVLKRPGVHDFLSAMAAQFEVVVFTAGLQPYADAVLDTLDPRRSTIRHRLYRDSCRMHLGGLVKDLSKLGRDLRKVIIVDNSPHSYLLQPSNAVPIASFFHDREDRELFDLIPFLSVLSEIDDVTDALRDAVVTPYSPPSTR